VGKYPDAYHWVIKKQPAERATLSAGRVMPEYHSKPFAQEILRQRMWGKPLFGDIVYRFVGRFTCFIDFSLGPFFDFLYGGKSWRERHK
jgi:hypothetical protein